MLTKQRIIIILSSTIKPLTRHFYPGLTSNSTFKNKEFYRPGFQADVCLNDGSSYPGLWHCCVDKPCMGFYNKVVLQEIQNPGQNMVELNGYKWNLHTAAGTRNDALFAV